jgi:hypothetical protein
MSKLQTSYVAEKIKLREWWVPDPKKMTFDALVRYYFTRDVYSTLGSFDIAVLVRADRLSLWAEQ